MGNPKLRFDHERFWADIERAVAREGVSWRGLARIVGVNPSTISPGSRVEVPGVAVACALANWAMVAIEEYLVEA